MCPISNNFLENRTEGSNPPRSATQSGLQRNSSHFLQKMREIARFLRFTSGKPDRRKRPAKRSSKRLRAFSLEGTNPVRFRRGSWAKTMRSQNDHVAKPT